MVHWHDNQTPPDDDSWPDDNIMDEWISGDGAEMLIERWQEENQGSPYLDFVAWTELNYDLIVEWFKDDYEPPEPNECIDRNE